MEDAQSTGSQEALHDHSAAKGMEAATFTQTLRTICIFQLPRKKRVSKSSSV